MSKDKSKRKDITRRKDKLKEEKITIREMIGNVTYLLKYAGRYDKPLILKIMILNILLLSGMAANDTFILKLIINGLAGNMAFKNIMV